MRDRESLSLCPKLPFMEKKNFVPSPSKVFGHLPSSTLCLIFHFSSSTWTPSIKSTLPTPCL